jgi:diacylglycerol O-acyltransferase / wax synthase
LTAPSIAGARLPLRTLPCRGRLPADATGGVDVSTAEQSRNGAGYLHRTALDRAYGALATTVLARPGWKRQHTPVGSGRQLTAEWGSDRERAMGQRSRGRGDRLTPLDMSNLRVEARGLPMHVAAVALLDRTPLVDSSGQLRLEAIRRHVEERSRQAQRLRQVLVWRSRGRGRPSWADDPTFDITGHVRTQRVPDPGDETSLLKLCCELNQPALDRGHPLWEMWLLTGLADGRVGLLIRLHHVIVDGIAAVELLSSMLDLAPDAKAPAAAPPSGAKREPHRGVSSGGRAEKSSNVADVVAEILSALSGIAKYVRMRARQGWAIARLGRAPSLSWNRPIGRRQRVMLLGADLGSVKAAAHTHGAKVNDVVLAAVAGGARRLLESRGELNPDLEIHVAVPASIRQPGETGGNRVGIRIIPVPVGEPDPIRRLRAIATRTAAQRGRPPYQPNGRFLQRWMVRTMFHQRLINIVVSNVVGPPVPLYFARARVHEVFQLSVLQGNLGLGVGVLSYAGGLYLDIAADVAVVPDVEVFTAGIADALERLGTVTVHGSPTTPR